MRLGIVVGLAVLVCGLAGAAEVRIADDFAGYAEGSLAGEGWETDAMSWQVREGRFRCDWPGTIEAFPRDPRLFKAVTVEATIIPRSTTGTNWKTVAVALKVDARHFWHLALVEAPASNDRRHFVELSEMRDGQWLAQNNLKVAASQGNNFAWEFDTAYRLRLTMNPEGIDGQVLDAQGQVVAHLGYAFSAPAVTEGRPCLRSSQIVADFDDFLVVAEGDTATVPPPPAEKTFPAYAVPGSGRAAPVAGNGFFQVVEVDGRWWLVDPRGELFYAVGTDHVNYYSHWCQKLGYAPYHKNAEKRHGSIEKWAESATARLRTWGFNFLGAGNIEAVRYQGLAHSLFVAFGSSFSGASALVEKTTWTGFPNVFDPRWEAYCAKLAATSCTANRQDPWLLGYFLDNELEWYGKSHREDGIWTDTMKWPADHTGKQALIAHVRQAHDGDLAQFNTVWEQKLATWDDLARLDALPAPNEQAKDIQVAFLAEVADRYFRVTTAAIRQADANHLIIGSRFAGRAPEWAWKACAKYCDVVTFNSYPRVDMVTEDLTPVADNFTDYFNMVGKPMMITEWSFPALDAGLPCTHGAGMRVDTQEQKTHCVEMMQHLNFRLPFMVGSDYFMWADEPAEGISDTFPEDSNYGLNDVNDEPYELLTAMFAKLNPMAIAIHAGEIPEGYIEKLAVEDGLLTLAIRNAGATEAVFTGRIETNDGLLAAPQLALAAGATGVCRLGKPEPGLHVLRAQLAAEGQWLPRGCRGRTALTACVLVPGPGVEAAGLLPLHNPTAGELPAAWTILSPTPEAGTLGQLETLALPDRTTQPAQWVAPQALAVALPPLNGGQTLAAQLAGPGQPVGAISLERLPNGGFRIDNGVLRIENDGTSGNVFDRFQLGDLLLGSYNPLIWQQPKDNQWTRADTFVNSEFLASGNVLVVDVTAEHRGGEAITAVDAAGKMPGANAAAVRFQIVHRFVVFPGSPYVAARLVRIRNLETVRPLTINGYFYYLPSAIGGDRAGDVPGGVAANVPNYYLRSAGTAWHDQEVGARYGVSPLGDGMLAMFWLDQGGGAHPDARVELKPAVVLPPGQDYTPPADAPFALIYGARDADWPTVKRQLAAAAGGRLVKP
ncbi:MAG: hypothetical protein RBU25_04335 [Lentisphaeria bacterium]|jgi:hypothetical protein|nr:hypothetical protein [Lentisphaeria bacterium]